MGEVTDRGERAVRTDERQAMAQYTGGRARRDGNVCRSRVSCYAGDNERNALRMDTKTVDAVRERCGRAVAYRSGLRLCRRPGECCAVGGPGLGRVWTLKERTNPSYARAAFVQGSFMHANAMQPALVLERKLPPTPP